MNICVYGASSNDINKRYIGETEKLGLIMAQHGHNLVYGGGANGVMGAVARGVTAGAGKVIGVAPTFFNVDGVLYDKCTELIPTKTMRERKQIMEDKADAFIMAPGGIGTYEEFFEILTLKQLSRHNKAIAVYNVGGFYNKLMDFLEHGIEEGFMTPACHKLFKLFDNAEEMLSYIESYVPEATKYKNF